MRNLTLRTIFFRVHWALGLTAGLVLAVMGLTGALMSYEEALTGWANRDRIAINRPAGSPMGLEELVARIEAQTPDLRVRYLGLTDGRVTTARFAPNPKDGSLPPTVYVDPYSGDVLGPMRWDAAFATLRALHRWLLLPGDGKGWGRQITGVSAMALVVFLATGLYLRWPKIHRWRIWLKPSLARPGRIRWWSLHAVAGTWFLPCYLVIALSGLTWSYGWFADGMNWLLTGSVSRAAAPPQGAFISRPALGRAWANFLENEGREAIPMSILLPLQGVQGIRIRWTANGSDAPNLRNETIFDGATGALLSSRRPTELPLGKRMAANMFEIHSGCFFGDFFKFVFFLAALAVPGFAGTGLTLYVLRRRANRRRV